MCVLLFLWSVPKFCIFVCVCFARDFSFACFFFFPCLRFPFFSPPCFPFTAPAPCFPPTRPRICTFFSPSSFRIHKNATHAKAPHTKFFFCWSRSESARRDQQTPPTQRGANGATLPQVDMRAHYARAEKRTSLVFRLPRADRRRRASRERASERVSE